ncbi:hypothetical protein ACFFX0_28035 [Citricoccus parietis]|uniref:Uncharacterized protein n=1 Tax=Citricoccus parietis TaxID=592307 RepID=A0ABV5G7A1_9MICC
MQQGALAAAVLADDGEAGTGGDGDAGVTEDLSAAAHHAEAVRAEMGGTARGKRRLRAVVGGGGRVFRETWVHGSAFDSSGSRARQRTARQDPGRRSGVDQLIVGCLTGPPSAAGTYPDHRDAGVNHADHSNQVPSVLVRSRLCPAVRCGPLSSVGLD